MEQTEEEILNLNRNQMYQGLGFDGNPLSPKYSEDPFFKTVESAMRYAEWKQRITPHPKRDIDTPNLFITGVYHGMLKMSVNERTYKIAGTDKNAADIERKFKTAAGLTDESKAQYRKTTSNPLLIRRIKIHTGCR